MITGVSLFTDCGTLLFTDYTVATVALNGVKNAGILAAQIVSVKDNVIRDKIIQYKLELKEQVIEKSKKMKT